MKHARLWMVSVLVLALGSTSRAQVTRRVSVAANGTQGNGDSGEPFLSSDGHSVAFYTTASNLLVGDSNGIGDIYSCDWPSRANEIVSVDSNEVLCNHAVELPVASADGHYVAFASFADNLVTGDTNGVYDVFIRDRTSGTTQRVSVSSAGVQGNGHSFYSSISANGRYVVFGSEANNLVAGDSNGVMDIFLRDVLSGTTERVSFGGMPGFIEANGRSIEPSVSADGRYVAFSSFATNFRPGDTNGCVDVFLRDRQQTTTRWMSIPVVGGQPNGHCGGPAISADGLHVAFLSGASNMVAGDTNGAWDVFIYHWTGNLMEIVSVSTSDAVADAESSSLSISGDGAFVAFASKATNLAPGDTNGVEDVFLRSVYANTTERLSVASNGTQADGASQRPSISGDGRFVAFASAATNLVSGDTNGVLDVFLRDRDATGFTSLCLPGAGGVISCPCSNPPTVSGRGCNNSAGTNGALLSAAGIAYLSADSLVFTTYGERASALSIVLQGTAVLPTGAVYGQGVRCVGGTLKRLYTKTASLGSITAPNFGAGDATVSARSAALGNPILPGTDRWYLVYYRDGVVLGGCPSTSKFNTTQTGKVFWGP